MLRFQGSWLLETVLDSVNDLNQSPSWYFPVMSKFCALEWLGNLDSTITINVPIHSQAVLFKSWFSNFEAFPDEEVMKAFNQILMKSIDLNINPFRAWLDVYFSKQQLDYLLYWHEAANELSTEGVKESFLAIVYQVINYWLVNNKAGYENLLPPDEILAYYYKRYRTFRNHQAVFNITEKSLENIEPKDCSILVFNLVFGDEDYLEDESLFIYNAWLYGYTDIEKSKQSFISELKSYSIELGNTNNYDFYLKLSGNAKVVAFCWSGQGVTPNLYQRMLVEQLQQIFTKNFKNSKFVYKSIDSDTNSYDYILLFY